MNNRPSIFFWIIATLLMLVLLAQATVRLVQEFHQRPAQVYYCSETGCDKAADA